MTSTFDWRSARSVIAAEMKPLQKVGAAPGSPGLSRPVEQLTLTGEVIRVYSSATEAGNAVGVQGSNIGRVAAGKRTTAGGYAWRYVPFGGAYSKASGGNQHTTRLEAA